MPNVLTKYLTRVNTDGNQRVTNADVLNTIRQMASENYKADIPEMGSMQSINHNSIPYHEYVVHQNEFFAILINKIGPTIVKALMFDNPLGVFRSENFEYGETLEEIYVGLADAEVFNAKDTTSPFMFRDTPIDVFYHDLNDERKYVRTIEKTWTMKAFRSDNSFDEFIDKMFTSLISSDQLDEAEAIKKLIPDSLTPVTITGGATISTPAEAVDTTQPDWVLNLNKRLITMINLFAFPSRTRFENGAGVPMATPVEDQYLIVNAEVASELDSLYANAFNMDKATPLAKKIVIDEFPVYTGPGPLNGVRPIAALVSRNTIIFKDKILELDNIYNPNTRSYNYFLHHHQLISYSLLENAHVFYEPAPTPPTP